MKWSWIGIIILSICSILILSNDFIFAISIFFKHEFIVGIACKIILGKPPVSIASKEKMWSFTHYHNARFFAHACFLLLICLVLMRNCAILIYFFRYLNLGLYNTFHVLKGEILKHMISCWNSNTMFPCFFFFFF